LATILCFDTAGDGDAGSVVGAGATEANANKLRPVQIGNEQRVIADHLVEQLIRAV